MIIRLTRPTSLANMLVTVSHLAPLNWEIHTGRFPQTSNMERREILIKNAF